MIHPNHATFKVEYSEVKATVIVGSEIWDCEIWDCEIWDSEIWD